MIENQNTAAGRGHVRAVFSGRCRGHAVPLDLVRAHLRAVARVALRARLAVEFGGYLVTECPDDAALRRLEIYGRKYAAKAAPFSKHRAGHQFGTASLCMTGGKAPLDVAWREVTGGPLDAPDLLPGGGCDELGAMFCEPPQIIALREPLEVIEPFAVRREYWADYAGRQNIGMSGPAGAVYSAGYAFRAGFDDGSLDSPDYFAAGSCRWLEYNEVSGKGFPAQRLMMRGRV